MSNEERYRYVHDYPFGKVHNTTGKITSVLNEMLRVAEEKHDEHTLLAIQFYFCLTNGPEGVTLPKGYNSYTLFQEIEKTGQKDNYPVEEAVARFHLIQHPYNPDFSNYQKKYTGLQDVFEQMQAIGFEKFKDYYVDKILLDMAVFMWDLEDYEKAFHYLSVAERFIVRTEEGGHTYTQVMSYLQTYWKRKKNYSRSLEYAHKIKRFHEQMNISADNIQGKWWNDFWKGYSDIEIADLLIKQGKPFQSELFADKGYLLTKASAHGVDEVSGILAEYDALEVLIDVKLELGKLHEANLLLQRALQIKKILEEKGRLDHFKPIKLYKCIARYNEQTGNAAVALDYTHKAQQLQDSLDSKNDAHKLAKAQQRFDAEKYARKIAAVEQEKRFHKMLRNAAIVILILVIALGFVYYKNVQASKKQKQKELNAAKSQLETLAKTFREKSEQADNLRSENEKLSAQGQKSQYLEQLSNATILTDEDWTNFRTLFEKVYPDFIAGQKEQYPSITPAEIRFMVLEKLGLTAQEMANTLGVNKNTIHQTRLRLRKKTDSAAA